MDINTQVTLRFNIAPYIDISKGMLKEKYSQLTDDDLLYIEGKEEQLIGRLQKSLGKSRNEVQQILKKLNESVLTK